MTGVHSTSRGASRDYNYDHFDPAVYVLDHPGGPRIGERAPDFTAERLADAVRVRPSDYAGKIVVLETGSATCPMYVQRIEAMNRLATRFTGTAFLVLYTREAHPGERIGAHRSLADKLGRAQLVINREAERRSILVDDLSGAAHKRLGGMPNMLYILDEQGTVVFRSEWNDPGAVAQVVEQLQLGGPMTSVLPHFRPASPATLWRVLHRAGWRAIHEFALGFPALAYRHARSATRPVSANKRRR